MEEIKHDIRTARIIYDKLKELANAEGGDRVKEIAGAVINNPPNEAFRNVALWLYAGGKSAFLQDANSLIMRTDELVEVIKFLKKTFPDIERVTSYGRSKTAAKKKPDELIRLREAGLSRLHIGLESGYDPLLEYMDKGVTAADHIIGGRRVVESGISLSEYVILGLGGRKMWREHATQTARVLNEIDPAFIRVRTLTINHKMPLYEETKNGNFVRATDEQIVEEERLFIEHLDCHANYVSDHINNLLQEVEGKLPEDRGEMLACLDRFQSLSPEERTNFKLGRRVGIYTRLDDLDDARRREVVEQVIHKLGQDNNGVSEKTIYSLMEGFV